MVNPTLRKLVLKRFRSIHDESVELDNPTFIVGQNGSGKSNFVDALSFLADAMTLPLQAVLDNRGGLFSVAHRNGRRGRSSKLSLAVELIDIDEHTPYAEYAFQLRALKGYGFEVVREWCIVKGSDRKIARFDRNNPPGNSRMRWKTNVRSLDPAIEPNALALPLVSGDSHFQAVARFLSEMRVYRIEPAVMKEMQEPDSGIRLHSNGRNIASVLREIRRRFPDTFFRLIEFLESAVPGTIDVRSERHGQKFTLVFVQDRGDSKPVEFEAFDMSDGTLRILGLLAAVFQRPAPTLLVIEEPEATIHPGALGAILDVLRHASRFMQVVVTTHSPDILDAKWITGNMLRIASMKSGATLVNPISFEANEVLTERIMGAGELLRSNALTSAWFFE